MTASLSVVSTTYTGDRRAWGIGMWSAIGSTAAAAAPVVGGLVVEALDWRWFFALNLPLLAVAFVMTLAVVPESHGDRRRIDLTGAALATVALTFAVLALQEAGTSGWSDPLVVAAGLVAVAVLGVFVLRERRSDAPLIPRGITASRAYRPPVAVAFLANWGFGALNILLTFWLQSVRGESAAVTGAVFLAYSVPFAVLGALTGRVVARFGGVAPMVLGTGLVAGSFLVLTQLGATSSLWVVLVAMALSGVGQGLAYNVSTTSAMAAVPDDDAGVASGLLTAMRNVGVAAGVAVATLATAGSATASSSDAPVAVTGAEFTEGLQRASWIIVAVSLLGTAVALAARAPRRSTGSDLAARS